MSESASFLISIRVLEDSLVLLSSGRPPPLASEPFIEFLARLGEPLTLTRSRKIARLEG